MTQEEFNAWIAAQGGSSAVQHTTENRTIPNPAKQGAIAESNPAIPATITVNVQTWVNPKTGAILSLSPTPGAGPGQYEVIKQTGTEPATASDAKPTQLSAPANTPQIGFLNPDGTVTWQNNPNYQQTAQEQAPISAPANTPYIGFRDAQGKVTWQNNPNYQGAETDKPVTVSPGNGEVGRVHPGGRYEVVRPPNPEKPEAPERVQDPETKEWLERQPGGGWAPIKIEGRPTPNVDLPALRLEAGQITTELTQLFEQLDAEVKAGRMTPAQASAMLEPRRKLAETKIAEVNGILTAQQSGFNSQVTQRGQSLDEVQSRRSLGATASTNAISTVFDAGQYVKPGSISGPEGLGAMRALYNMQMQGAQQAGGMREVPEIAVPPATAQAMKLTLAPGVSLEVPAGLAGLSGLQQQMSGGVTPAPAAAAPAPAPGPLDTPQPAMPPAPTAQVTPMSIAQSLLAEDDDEDWQYGVNKAMSLLL